MTPPLIILGAGLAGWSTAREFRKLDTTTPVLLITADKGDFYAKPALSNALAHKRDPAQLVSTPAAQMAASLQVTLLPQTQVLALDPQDATVITERGPFRYRQLVLASGAQPIRVPLAGDAADQVLSINSLDDFSIFHARLTAGPPARKRVLIMGAGLIGCEFANDLAAAGHQVHVVDPSAGPLAALLPVEAAEQLRAALTDLGVRWHFGCSVQSVQHAHGNTGASPLALTLSNGLVLEADLVLSAIGLRANTALAQAAGLVCDRAVLVDGTLQTSQPAIYALGDVAQYAGGRWGGPAPVRGGRTLPYVLPIMAAAKALAVTLSGTATEVVFPLMPVAVKTPALPIVVAAPAPGTPGRWQRAAPGRWQLLDPQGQVRGFVLTGLQTSQRVAQAQLVVP